MKKFSQFDVENLTWSTSSTFYYWTSLMLCCLNRSKSLQQVHHVEERLKPEEWRMTYFVYIFKKNTQTQFVVQKDFMLMCFQIFLLDIKFENVLIGQNHFGFRYNESGNIQTRTGELSELSKASSVFSSEEHVMDPLRGEFTKNELQPLSAPSQGPIHKWCCSNDTTVQSAFVPRTQEAEQ